VLTAILIVVGALAIFVAWRYTSVARGARKRDEALLKRLDPLAARFEAKQAVTASDVAELARYPELRSMLYALVTHYGRAELFPADLLRKDRQAEAVLAYWLQHPNELQAAPEAIEYVEMVRHAYAKGVAEFFVLRYRMPAGHWAGTDWLVGVAGPFLADEKPFESVAGGFSRSGDVFGKTDTKELVRWYAGIHERRLGGSV
jgi:hypothetical protein